MANQLKQKQQAVILDSVTRLWKTGMMADIKLQCAGGVVSAHKSFLRAVSPFFDALISKTTHLERIQFDFKVNAVKTVVDFLYSGEIPEELNEDLVLITEILAIAHVLDITLLFDHYWVMFNDLLSTSNFLLHLLTAEEYGQRNTMNEVITFMVDNLEDVTREDSFNQLNKDQMEELIQLAVEKKIQAEVVVSCILKWGEFNQEGRSRIVLKWIEFVGLSKLSNIQLQGLFQNALVKNCDELNKVLVTEAIHRLTITESVNNGDESAKTLHIRVTSISIENGRAKEEIQSYDTQEKLWTTRKTVSFPREQYSSLYVILNPDGEPYYFTRNSNNEIVAYNPLYNRSVVGCTFSKKVDQGVRLEKTFCFVDDDIIAQYCTESEQWKTIRRPFTSISNRCALMSCCAELFLYDYENYTLYKYGFNYEGWCMEKVSPEPLTHVWSKCLSQSCQRRLFFTNRNHVLTTYDTKTKEWKKYPNCDLVNGSVLLASCDNSFVMFSKQSTLMFYNCESDTTECLPSGGISGTHDYYLK